MNKRIYVIDDDPDFLELARFRLQGNSFEVKTFDDAVKAVKAIRLHKPDLVMTDIKMPGLSGLEVYDLMRKNPKTSDVPIIFVTGFDGKREYVESFNDRSIFYMEKPFQNGELLATVHAAFESACDFQ